MKGLQLIRPESDALTLKAEQFLVYAYFVSEVVIDDTDIISTADHSSVFDRIKLPAEKIDSAMDELLKRQLIFIKKDVVFVGTCTDKIKSLFTGATSDFSKQYERLLKGAKTYINDCSSPLHKNIARAVHSKLTYLQEKEVRNFTINDFMVLFNCGYAVTYQQEAREAMSKEWGQLKKFVELFDKTEALNLMLHYLLNYEKWSSTLSIGTMVYMKDDIRASVNKSIRKTTKRAHEEDEAF
jgi:hypothetical protein